MGDLQDIDWIKRFCRDHDADPLGVMMALVQALTDSHLRSLRGAALAHHAPR